MTEPRSITRLPIDWSNGNHAELTPRVYEELHALARTYLNRDRPNQTLQPAARLMRRVPVDYARAHRAVKRGGDFVSVILKETMAFSPEPVTDILAVDEALTRLAQIDDRKAEIIELRYFAGMTSEETAHATGLSVATVKRDLRLAEAWLQRHFMGHA